MRYLSILLAAVLLTGCVHTYELGSSGSASSLVSIPRASFVYVGMSEPGRFANDTYEESGRQTTTAIANAILPYTANVTVADKPTSTDASLAAAKAAGASYLIQPSILHWEERATEWSGLPDRISVRLELFDVEKKELLDSTNIGGKSRWATLGGDHPQELLPEPLSQYAKNIFKAD